VRSLAYLNSGGAPRAFNLGAGRGLSVREIVEAVGRVSGVSVPVESSPRREGDPPILIADPSLALRELDWSPRQSGLDSIIETAWAWHNRPPR